MQGASFVFVACPHLLKYGWEAQAWAMALVVPGALPLPGAAHVWRQPGAARPQAQHLRSGRSGLGALAGLGWAGLRRTRIPARAKPKPDPSTYVPVLLEMPEGQTYQIEAHPPNQFINEV